MERQVFVRNHAIRRAHERIGQKLKSVGVTDVKDWIIKAAENAYKDAQINKPLASCGSIIRHTYGDFVFVFRGKELATIYEREHSAVNATKMKQNSERKPLIGPRPDWFKD